jgi:hypothetical protein
MRRYTWKEQCICVAQGVDVLADANCGQWQ